MNTNKFLFKNSILTIFLISISCANSLENKILQEKQKEPFKITNNPEVFEAESEHLHTSPSEMSRFYVSAITQFIKAVQFKDKITFDTLYFGKHVYGQSDDFPDIDLPETIENSQIRMITPENGQILQKARTDITYVNLMSWISNEKAEFLFVVFSNHSQHQFDCHVNYEFRKSLKGYQLINIFFENFLQMSEHKPKLIPIYSNGKYIRPTP